ncbi:hypothetical protein [Streptomyces ossamyceticus]|uniref:hypothetical protein n=1 Tax=Streptomyces ossamyceticus TaxID=249581 RepID=UPI0006E21DAD|nr:hypothetical protein [Streptomyces ossamyceticus]
MTDLAAANQIVAELYARIGDHLKTAREQRGIATWEPQASEQRAECDTADADWIAAMHPGVGLALADWLEQEAHHYECGIRAADDVFRDDPAGRAAFLTTGPGAPSPQALAVARAINGQEQP